MKHLLVIVPLLAATPALAVDLTCTAEAKDFSLDVQTLGREHKVVKIQLFNKGKYVVEFEKEHISDGSSDHLRVKRVAKEFNIDSELDFHLAKFSKVPADGVALELSGYAENIGFHEQGKQFACSATLPDAHDVVYNSVKDCLVEVAGVAEPLQISDDDLVGSITRNIAKHQNACVNVGLADADLPTAPVKHSENAAFSKMKIFEYIAHITKLVEAQLK